MRSHLLPSLTTCVLMACAIGAGSLSAADQPQRSEGSWITISGTAVDPGPNHFTLDYGEGTISVKMDGQEWRRNGYSTVEDNQVTVSGRLDENLYDDTTLKAISVYDRNQNQYFYARSAQGDQQWHDPSWEPVTIGKTTVRGTVQAVRPDERRFTIRTGSTTLTVNTKELGYNPLDEAGYQKIRAGDRVSVTGKMSDQVLEERELDATKITAIGRRATGTQAQRSERDARDRFSERDNRQSRQATMQERSRSENRNRNRGQYDQETRNQQRSSGRNQDRQDQSIDRSQRDQRHVRSSDQRNQRNQQARQQRGQEGRNIRSTSNRSGSSSDNQSNLSNDGRNDGYRYDYGYPYDYDYDYDYDSDYGYDYGYDSDYYDNRYDYYDNDPYDYSYSTGRYDYDYDDGYYDYGYDGYDYDYGYDGYDYDYDYDYDGYDNGGWFDDPNNDDEDGWFD